MSLAGVTPRNFFEIGKDKRSGCENVPDMLGIALYFKVCWVQQFRIGFCNADTDVISSESFNDDFALVMDFQYKPLRHQPPSRPCLQEGREDGLQSYMRWVT